MGVLSWKATHFLDPFRPLKNQDEGLTIQVVAAPYQWVFIYPKEKIATVNEIYFPVDTPIDFVVTSDFSMNSFFIPQLGGQIYAMAGMKSQVHLIAEQPGVFDGMSSNYSGHGFSKMKFTAHAVDDAQYQAWLKKAKSSGGLLDMKKFKSLQAVVNQTASNAITLPPTAPSPDPVQYFAMVVPNLFQKIVDQYMTDNHPTLYGSNLCTPDTVVLTEGN